MTYEHDELAKTGTIRSHIRFTKFNEVEGNKMPAVSKAQQKAAGAALSAKRGEIPKSKLVGASLEMYNSMTEKELDELASVKRTKLPEHKSPI